MLASQGGSESLTNFDEVCFQATCLSHLKTTLEHPRLVSTVGHRKCEFCLR